MSHAVHPKRVLVPVDMSEASRASLTAARGVADRFGARLTVLFVDNGAHWVRDAVATFGAFVDTKQAMERRTESQHDKLRSFICSAVGVESLKDIEFRVLEESSPSDTICRIAAEENFDWICMSAAGSRGWRKLFVGSTAAAVVRNSTIPVLTLRRPEDAKSDLMFHDMRHVLVALDLTDSTPALVALADAIAGDSGQVTLSHVVESVTDYGLYGTPVTAPSESVRLAEEWSARELDKIEKTVRHARLGKSRVVTGRPAEQLLDLEEEVDPDLLVLGTHGRTGMDRLAMGSVAESVVRHAAGPVLVVPSRLCGHGKAAPADTTASMPA